ncbi:porin OmpA [Zophobihabitans entericus]|uniref:Porin OmpA n=1 Tax=Zophobihabitans entericus TaxID=1635327 RepID=A0A6G9IFG1_9GAMM|nr:porin OmpA [Zophobihabitans entericus]QIQ22330.1 porin OmpA [Zophobihabitans entericus]
MKKTTLALAVAIASLTTAAYAAQPENTWYIGGKAGWSSYHDATFYNGASDNMHISKDRVGGGVFLGYQATDYAAIELGYDWLGHADYRDKTTGDKSQLRVQGIQLAAKLSYPLSFISEDLDIYTRLGGFIAMTKYKSPTLTDSDSDVAPLIAAGFEYKLSEDFAARLDYQWINNIDNKGDLRPDNSLLSLGISYNFGGGAPAKTTSIDYKENRYVLNEDVLFGYNQSTLKAEGEEALNGLVSALTKINPSEGAVVVIGHTDRIGSAAYNQKLSEQRAKTVMDYLVAKGIPSDLITAKGAGKSSPITGDKCNSLTGADLKACLAPDRRVEIEINAKNVEEVEVTN